VSFQMKSQVLSLKAAQKFLPCFESQFLKLVCYKGISLSVEARGRPACFQER
jgi:hypothetical protein